MDSRPGVEYLLKAAGVFVAVVGIAISHRQHHPFDRFGLANQVTAVRALLVALVTALIGEPHAPALPLVAIGLSATATVLDSLDGWLARRSQMTSAFGARFDMETDALLILALSILAWRYGKAGVWVLASGLTRYVFVGAGRLWPWLRAPLPGSTRGKTVCVVQIGGLLVALVPSIAPPASSLVAAASLAALWYSFAIDTWWLWSRRSHR